jgi:hypothetical protein
MKQRKLKVRKGHWDYTLKNEPYSGNRIIPFLLLKGTWLEQAGFNIDTPVSVSVKGGQLLIIKNSNQ